ncbi:hypothetical protein C1646_711287, partial [Rhizophagus diaphanus]
THPGNAQELAVIFFLKIWAICCILFTYKELHVFKEPKSTFFKDLSPKKKEKYYNISKMFR